MESNCDGETMTWPTTTRTPDTSIVVAGARPRWTAATDVHRESVP